MNKKRIFMLETKRQLVHLLLGLTISFAVYYLTPLWGSLVLAPLIIALTLLYTVPKKFPNLRIANHLILHFERDCDAISCPFKGSIWYGVGMLAPLSAHFLAGMPLEVTCMIIAVLSIGDSTSTWFGKFFGRVRIGEKSLLGFLAFFIFSALGALIYLPGNIAAGIIFGFFGAILEIFPLVDDNLQIPFGLTIIYFIIDALMPSLLGI